MRGADNVGMQEIRVSQISPEGQRTTRPVGPIPQKYRFCSRCNMKKLAGEMIQVELQSGSYLRNYSAVQQLGGIDCKNKSREKG